METSPNKLQYFRKITSVNKTYIVEKKDIKRIIQCILMIRLKLKTYKTIEKNESRGITDKLFNIIKFKHQ